MLGCLQRCVPTTFCPDTDWIYIARRFASAGQPIGTVRTHHVRTASINPSRSEQTMRQPIKGSWQRRCVSIVLFPVFVPPEPHETTTNDGDEVVSNHAPCPRPCRTWWHRKGKWRLQHHCRFIPTSASQPYGRQDVIQCKHYPAQQ